MIRIVVTVLVVQIAISVAAIHWLSGKAYVTINKTHADEATEIFSQRYVQTVHESGTLLFGVREEGLKSHHRTLKLSGWSGTLKYPSADNPTASTGRTYRYGISTTTHDKGVFNAIYIYVRIWLFELLIFILGGCLWVDKWLFPIVRVLRRSIKKEGEQGADGDGEEAV